MFIKIERINTRNKKQDHNPNAKIRTEDTTTIWEMQDHNPNAKIRTEDNSSQRIFNITEEFTDNKVSI